LPLWLLHKIDRKKEKKEVSCGSFTGDFSPNFDLGKNDFDLYKRFLMGKEMAQIRQISS
jgi:hypothetical protein